MGYHDRDGQGILLIIGITFRLTLGADMYTDLLARLTAEHSARLRAIDAVWAPLPVPSISPGTVVVPARANAAAVVTTSTFAADTPAAMWATRVCHDITLRVGAAATDSDVVETLRLAIAEARRHDARTARADRPIPDDDRHISLVLPARDAELATAAAKAGFRLLAVDGLKQLATIADPPVHAQDPAGQSAPVEPFDAPGPDDVDPLTTALFKLAMFDTSFMYGIIRDGLRDFIRKDAEAAVRAGAGWTQVLRGEGQSLDAALVIVPPSQEPWWSNGVDVGTSAYVSFAWTEPTLRGRGIASAMLQAGERFAAAQGVDALFIGYAAGNPLSGPLWSRHGFRPLRSHWSMPLS